MFVLLQKGPRKKALAFETVSQGVEHCYGYMCVGGKKEGKHIVKKVLSTMATAAAVTQTALDETSSVGN